MLLTFSEPQCNPKLTSDTTHMHMNFQCDCLLVHKGQPLSILRCVFHGTSRGLHLIRISMEFLLYALLNLWSIKHNNGIPRRCSRHIQLILTKMLYHVMFIKLSFMFMIDKYVMFDWYTFVKPIMTFQLKCMEA